MKWLRRLPQAPVTSALILANLAIYVWMVAATGTLSGFDSATMTYFGANVPGSHQVVSHARWLTAAFVHFNLLHVAVNMWSLLQIGVMTEATIGAGLIGAAYVLTGIGGNIASTIYFGWRDQPTHSAGASSAIMGLIGIAAAFAWRTGQKGITRMLLINFGVLFVLGMAVNIDNAAHFGGFVTGALIGLARARWPQPLPRVANAALLGASLALTVIAFAVMRSYHGMH